VDHAVALLDFPDELLALAADDLDIIVGELAPFFLELSLVLLPFTFKSVPNSWVLLPVVS